MSIRHVTLGCVPYEVTETDGQLIFTNKSGFSGLHTSFAFEWKKLGWYLVDCESTFGRIFVPHIVAAYSWVDAHYVRTYDKGSATVQFYEDPPPPTKPS